MRSHVYEYGRSKHAHLQHGTHARGNHVVPRAVPRAVLLAPCHSIVEILLSPCGLLPLEMVDLAAVAAAVAVAAVAAAAAAAVVVVEARGRPARSPWQALEQTSEEVLVAA